MSVTVKFWSFSKRKNSTLIPTASPSYSYDCQIKAETTLINPIIELNTDQAKGCNYAQITDFGRYYFIRDWTFDRGLWTASLEEDVLASYKSEIGSQTMYVTRSASLYDGNIKDLYYPTTDAVTEDNALMDTGRDFDDGIIVIGVLGNQYNNSNPATVYYQLELSAFRTLLSDLFTTADNEFAGSDFVQGLKNALVNPTQYIVSCRWYPYLFTLTGTAVDKLRCGLWDMTNKFQEPGDPVVCRMINKSVIDSLENSVAIPKHPKATARGSYMNLPPFTKYQIVWGGTYDIDASLIANETALTWHLYPDFTSTQALLKVVAGYGAAESARELLSVYVPYGFEIPIGQGMSENAVSNLMTGAGSMAMGALGGGPEVLLAGMTSAVKSVADLMFPTITSSSPGSGIAVAALPKYLKAVFYDVVDDDLADFGRPLMKKKQISTLSGFVRCQNDDISIACLDPERESIRAFMTGGFFYE